MKQAIQKSSKFREVLRKLSPKLLLSFVIFVVLFIPSIAFKVINSIRGKKLWLIAEDGEARDNGYWLFKYIRENHKSDNCYYAVKWDSKSSEKVKKLGNVVKWGGVRHWLYYMSASLNISSQKSGNPDVLFWYFLHVKLHLYNNRIFIQHGITHNYVDWLNYKNAHFRKFICGATDEYNFVKKYFGYDEKDVVLAGFSRWDGFIQKNNKTEKRSIVIMPTWRNWIAKFANKKDFVNTDYYNKWNGLLNDKTFIDYIEKNGYTVYFIPHINMYKYIDCFDSISKNIIVVKTSEEIFSYLIKCEKMITDYSSVAFDFAYMGKPVIYYQFDYSIFRAGQYSEGYFDYKKDGFGPVVNVNEEIVKGITQCEDAEYRMRMDRFFGKTRMTDNSDRIYKYLSDKNNFKYMVK